MDVSMDNSTIVNGRTYYGSSSDLVEDIEQFLRMDDDEDLTYVCYDFDAIVDNLTEYNYDEAGYFIKIKPQYEFENIDELDLFYFCNDYSRGDWCSMGEYAESALKIAGIAILEGANPSMIVKAENDLHYASWNGLRIDHDDDPDSWDLRFELDRSYQTYRNGHLVHYYGNIYLTDVGFSDEEADKIRDRLNPAHH